jgi:hypothetical protein
VRDAHSLYLEPLAEVGIGGFVAIAVFVVGMLVAAVDGRRGLRLPREVGMHAALVVAAVLFFLHAGVDWLWESTAVSLLGITCACVAAARLSEPAPRRPAIGVRMLAGIAALALAAAQVPGLVATTGQRASTRALADGRKGQALKLASEALSAEPWAAGLYASRAQILQASGRPRAARADFVRATEAEPRNWRYWFLLARLDAAEGRPEAAIRSLAQARRLNPRSDVFQR